MNDFSRPLSPPGAGVPCLVDDVQSVEHEEEHERVLDREEDVHVAVHVVLDQKHHPKRQERTVLKTNEFMWASSTFQESPVHESCTLATNSGFCIKN